MAKHIILVHGRAIKPAGDFLKKLAVRAVKSGLGRAGEGGVVGAIDSGAIRISSAYYGDISNAILASKDKGEAAKLTDKDPDHGNAPCFPAAPLEAAFNQTDARRRFDAKTYKEILRNADDWRFLDEAADVVSLFGALLSAGLLNKTLIDLATSDMGAYLSTHKIASDIRKRLGDILEPAIMAGDDICLLTHSMGCMVAYDLMWKYAHMSEYAALRARGNPVKLWLTFGCPLGEYGVRRNLLDGAYADAEDKYPRGMVRDWINIHAEDDFVAHVEKIAPLYRAMTDKASGEPRIRDVQVYNCWTYEDVAHGRLVSNPHDFYGYLMGQSLASSLAGWAKTP